jgi:hypothetical protein
VNITRKTSVAATQKRSLQPNQIEDVMPAEQTETFDAVHFAAHPISIEIDAMIAALPAGTDLTEIAFDLIDKLEARCDCSEFIAIFKEALIGRQALTELGIKLDGAQA